MHDATELVFKNSAQIYELHLDVYCCFSSLPPYLQARRSVSVVIFLPIVRGHGGESPLGRKFTQCHILSIYLCNGGRLSFM